jgi:cysteine desulfurase
MRRIYLDYNASTPTAPEVAEAMRGFLVENYGNPSSTHWAGAGARTAVDRARAQVAGLLGCSPEEVIFTSGGSEANNHAIKGAFFEQRSRGNHLITTRVEHPAILQPCRFLETLGAEVTYLPVDRTGRVDPEDARRAITDRTILITVMHANNEVGTVQPIRQIARLARERGVLFHTDAAQSVGKIPASVDELGVDMLSVAGHKLYAPKGVGALYLRKGVRIEPLIHGAGHEGGRRAGTESVLLDVGLGAACELASGWIGMPETSALRDRFWKLLVTAFGDRIALNGRSGEAILSRLDGVAASTGSACHSGQVTLSPVLQAMGVPPEVGMGAVRFSLGRQTTRDEIEGVVARLRHVLQEGAPVIS